MANSDKIYDPASKNCVVQAWQAHESEMRGFLLTQLGQEARLADDLLQEVFLKAIAQGAGFCTLDNPRAWLFRVMRNLLVDHFRRRKPVESLPEELPEDVPSRPAVDSLARCLPAALQDLSQVDRDVIEQCDLAGLKQQKYAELHNMSLPAVKARIQRARKRLKQALKERCQPRMDERGNICCVPGEDLSTQGP